MEWFTSPHLPRPQSTCKLCGASSSRAWLLPLCRGCYADLPWIDSACKHCGLPLPDTADHLLCGECLTNSFPFTKAVIPFCYQAPLSSLINGFKHHQQLATGSLLGQLLVTAVQDQYLEDALPDCIVPVPLHWKRLIRRGFNQTAELGKQLGKNLRIPCQPSLLKRNRPTPHQQGLDRQRRLKNLRGAFTLQVSFFSKMPVYKKVALLDDVVTTGATATEIGRILLAHGVEEVHLWALARTPLQLK